MRPILWGLRRDTDDLAAGGDCAQPAVANRICWNSYVPQRMTAATCADFAAALYDEYGSDSALQYNSTRFR